jgi:uroporphyrinogen decarboxylase
MKIEHTRFMKACRLERADTTPVWFMRQAGRVLPEYRKIREKYNLLEICRQPELCAEVTLQPVRRLGVDAAVMFADIMLPLMSIGVDLQLVDNVGPVIANPVRDMAGLEALRPIEPEEDVPYVLEAVRAAKRELGDETPLIGFSGAPFTLAAYLIEGKPSREFGKTKAMMYGEPQLWHALMERLTRIMIRYLHAKVDAGADALQLFDSWVGALSPRDYAQYVEPYSRLIIGSLRERGVPFIHFGTGTATLLDLIKEDGGTTVGVDWRIPLDAAWERIGYNLGIQGNLDPCTLLGPAEVMEEQALDVLRRAAGRPGHIFNLGHGVLPDTPLVNLMRLVDFVHEQGADAGIRDQGSGIRGRRQTLAPGPRPLTPKIGVLIMAYGTPETPDQVEAYFTHIRGGRKPSEEAVQNLRERYAMVGGKTPLLEITNQVASKLEERLRREGSGAGDFKVYAGMKHWHPFIGDVMEKMAADGVGRVVALALAPHCSRISLGGYRKSVNEAQENLRHPFDIPFIKCWHHNPLFRDMMTGLVREGLEQFPAEGREAVTVVFSAHSLPERIREWDDPYERQLLESSQAVALQAGVSDWRFAFQSAGHTGEPWLGPDIVDYLETLRLEGKHQVLQVPIGFVSDHLEILYDIDIEAKQKAEELGMTLYRTQLPNARPEFIEVLASVVKENLEAPVSCWCYPSLKAEPVNFVGTLSTAMRDGHG